MKKGWQTQKIGEVFQVTDYVANGSFATLRENVKYLDTPDYAVLVRLADFTNGFDKSKFVYVDKHAYDFLSKSSLKGGELIMSNVGSIGKVFKCPDLGMPMTLAPNSIVINTPNNDFYYYYFLSSDFQKKLLDISSQVTLAKFNKTSFKTLEIPIPSISEQQRIVSLLDAEFAKIDTLKANAERNLQNAKDLFQAALKKELEPKEGWQKKTIKDVCSIFGRIGYRGYTRNDLVDNAEEGAITLSPSNIVDNEMVYDKVTYISWFKYEESPEIMIFDDDILLVKTGSSYGKCALVKNLPHKATINPQFVVLKNININRCFLNYYLRTPYSKARFDEFVSGTAIPTFSQSNLGNMYISFPSIKEQQSIVSHLDTLNEKCKTLQANYEKTLSLCDDLKQALLRKAFNGKF